MTASVESVGGEVTNYVGLGLTPEADQGVGPSQEDDRSPGARWRELHCCRQNKKGFDKLTSTPERQRRLQGSRSVLVGRINDSRE